MADLVLGSEGQIGKPLLELLGNRNIKIEGYDKIKPISLQNHYDMIHVAIPFTDSFIEEVSPYRKLTDNLVIHSTVKPGTSEKLGAMYSPIRGVHHNMYWHIDHFQKYYSNHDRNNEFEKRFPNNLRVQDSTSLEFTKILVDTTYLGLLVWYRKYVDRICPTLHWDFASEINTRYGNRPIMYNTEQTIGGHCVVPNMSLIDDPGMKLLQRLII